MTTVDTPQPLAECGPDCCTYPCERAPRVQPPQPMSRRDVWLTIALAVAKGEIDEPDEVGFVPSFDGRPPYVTLRYSAKFGSHDHIRPAADTLRMAARAAAALGLTSVSDHPDGILREWTAWDRDGWNWEVQARLPKGTDYDNPSAPEPSPLASEVIAAIGSAS